jgi:hypothetical protein
LACISSLSLMPMVCRFILLMEPQHSCIFFHSSWVFSLRILVLFKYVFCFWALKFSYTCSSLQDCLSTVFLILLKEILFPEFLFDSFFEIFHIFGKVLFRFLCCLIYFIYLFYNLLSLVSEFVEILLEFIRL